MPLRGGPCAADRRSLCREEALCAAERRPVPLRGGPVPLRGGPCAAERRPLCREEAPCR